MKVLGIIAEYNPFHLGHAYHIQKAKEMTDCDYVIAIMSGSFTQAGNIAIYDKFTRAKLACQNGVDMVIELPTIYANASAPYFAYGATRILDQLHLVSSLCFGSEISQIATLQKAAHILVQQEKNIWNAISENLEQGCSFASAREQALQNHLDSSIIADITSPNNILGLEYMKSLEQLKSPIQPYLLERKGAAFHDLNLNTSHTFASATSIREHIYHCHNHHTLDILPNVHNFVPENTWEVIQSKKTAQNEDFYKMLQYQLLSLTREQLSQIQEVTEGMENRILQKLAPNQSYDSWLHTLKSKRYQMSKIKRMLINILLSITKEDMKQAIHNRQSDYAHILAITEGGKSLLPNLQKQASIPIITSYTDSHIETLPTEVQHLLKIDQKATDIHSICQQDSIKKDYTNHL